MAAAMITWLLRGEPLTSTIYSLVDVTQCVQPCAGLSRRWNWDVGENPLRLEERVRSPLSL